MDLAQLDILSHSLTEYYKKKLLATVKIVKLASLGSLSFTAKHFLKWIKFAFLALKFSLFDNYMGGIFFLISFRRFDAVELMPSFLGNLFVSYKVQKMVTLILFQNGNKKQLIF